jgi:hypothetical protein
MRLRTILSEIDHLTEKGVPGKDKTLSFPGDCKRRILVRAANNDPLHVVSGGEHDRVVDKKGITLTAIPHGEPTPGVCQNVIKVLNDPDKASAARASFRGTNKR